MTHKSGSASANRVAWRSHDAASSGQVTTVSTVPPADSQRRVNAVTAAAAAERPPPTATLRAPRRSASSVILRSSARPGLACDPAGSQARPGGSRGDNVISRSSQQSTLLRHSRPLGHALQTTAAAVP
ncbi:MAG TPA: hypothetical protein VGG54_28750 [Trebonia sp.]